MDDVWASHRMYKLCLTVLQNHMSDLRHLHRRENLKIYKAIHPSEIKLRIVDLPQNEPLHQNAL
jgi:hypothetical protein